MRHSKHIPILDSNHIFTLLKIRTHPSHSFFYPSVSPSRLTQETKIYFNDHESLK